MTELVAVLMVLLAPAGVILGWLAVMAVFVAALSGAASGGGLISPRPDPTIEGRSAASSR